MNDQTIGTCSICGGPVTVPAVWHSVLPAVPQCRSCGAVAASHGPVIPMRPAQPGQTFAGRFGDTSGTFTVTADGQLCIDGVIIGPAVQP